VCSGWRVACDVDCSGTRVACVYWRIAADTAASTEALDSMRPHHSEQAAVAFHLGIPVCENPNTLSQTPQGISKISTWFAMPRSERFSGVAAMPFDCNNFEASLSVTTPLVAKMERDVASPWTRAAIFTVRPK